MLPGVGDGIAVGDGDVGAEVDGGEVEAAVGDGLEVAVADGDVDVGASPEPPQPVKNRSRIPDTAMTAANGLEP